MRSLTAQFVAYRHTRRILAVIRIKVFKGSWRDKLLNNVIEGTRSLEYDNSLMAVFIGIWSLLAYSSRQVAGIEISEAARLTIVGVSLICVFARIMPTFVQSQTDDDCD